MHGKSWLLICSNLKLVIVNVKTFALLIFYLYTQADEIEFFESQDKDLAKQAELMLQVWSEQDEPENITASKLQSALDKCEIHWSVPSWS